MNYTILDCYTDEPAGLGVPPYLGVYPRYIAGRLNEKEVNYITIDDLRKFKLNEKKEINRKTNIRIYNTTNKDISRILKKTDELIVVLGVHTPGKYLSAIPGTLREISALIKDISCRKVLTGPAVFGTQSMGGRFFERTDLSFFDEIRDYNFDFSDLRAKQGAYIIKQIPDLRIIEIETGRGCSRLKGCSFCLEPVKHKGAVFRRTGFIIDEIKEFYKLGARYFRLGKQSCFFSYPWIKELLEGIWKNCPDIEVLHIDNANPSFVTEDKTKLIVKYCTEGNVAAFGAESFDRAVIKANNLNATPESVYKAVKLINKHGSKSGKNGMPAFLPGINLLFGLKDESKNTHKENMHWLKKILDEDLLLRRINIRQVNIYPETDLFDTCKNKFIKKNKKHYWKWRNEVRQEIDNPMLKKLVPVGRVLKKVRMEIYDGNTTFGRQVGTYTLIVGIKKRIELNKFYDIKITGHMLRSVTGEIIN
ncbi:radical SAM protein [Candidatus Woesearchaeota archaeon]|nr:radical SAM protein [Candidatus Woesearchaeota archaeon]